VTRHDLTRACRCSARWASRSTPRRGCGTASVIGRGVCPIVDTWWQTETGRAHAHDAARRTRPSRARAGCPSSASTRRSATRTARRSRRAAGCSRPQALAQHAARHLGRPRPVHRDVLEHVRRRRRAGAARASPYYFAGDGAQRDEDGYFWIMGRVDDVINVSGHRLGHHGGRERAGEPTPRSSRRRSWACRTRSRARGSRRSARSSPTRRPRTPTAADALKKALRAHVGDADRGDRQAGPDPVHRRAAQDPEREDHAPPAARRRGGRREIGAGHDDARGLHGAREAAGEG
jgi:hypothetical protein